MMVMMMMTMCNMILLSHLTSFLWPFCCFQHCCCRCWSIGQNGQEHWKVEGKFHYRRSTLFSTVVKRIFRLCYESVVKYFMAQCCVVEVQVALRPPIKVQVLVCKIDPKRHLLWMEVGAGVKRRGKPVSSQRTIYLSSKHIMPLHLKAVAIRCAENTTSTSPEVNSLKIEYIVCRERFQLLYACCCTFTVRLIYIYMTV